MRNLEEIETTIAALKKRYADLDTKLVVNGTVDGDIAMAMSAVDIALREHHKLREQALVGDLIAAAEPRKPTAAPIVRPKIIHGKTITTRRDAAGNLVADVQEYARVADNPDDDHFENCQTLRRAQDFKPGNHPDPIDDMDHLPEDAGALREVHEKLFSSCLEKVNKFVSSARGEINLNFPVGYTQGQHNAINVAIAFVLTQARMIGALGRDRRNALEAKLVARIEALEARPPFPHEGIWDPEKTYPASVYATYGGSLFWSKCESKGVRPGDGAAAWLLVCKRGRDGKDAR